MYRISRGRARFSAVPLHLRNIWLKNRKVIRKLGSKIFLIHKLYDFLVPPKTGSSLRLWLLDSVAHYPAKTFPEWGRYQCSSLYGWRKPYKLHSPKTQEQRTDTRSAV